MSRKAANDPHGGRLELRPHKDGSFDELMLYDGQGRCLVHFEMQSSGQLFVGIYPRPEINEREALWITAKRGKLAITVESDSGTLKERHA